MVAPFFGDFHLRPTADNKEKIQLEWTEAGQDVPFTASALSDGTLLQPHFSHQGIYLTPIIVETSTGYRGGVVSYGKVKNQIIRLCRQDPGAFVSTMIDLYALPGDFPGKSDAAYPIRGTGAQKAIHLENAIAENIGEPNFIPYFMVHEFEALLFTAPDKFGEWTFDDKVVDALQSSANAYDTPEDINDHPDTAPSKRIIAVMPTYQKTFHGPLIASEIGLDALRGSCRHFDAWLGKLAGLASMEAA